MNKIRVLNFLLIHLFVLTACSTTDNVKLFTSQIAADNQAVVYIYRPFVTSNMMYSPDLYINDEFKLSIKNGKNTPLLLAPGENKFELEAKSKITQFKKLKVAETTNYEKQRIRAKLSKLDKL